ncbi:hypothetical protein LR900_001509, partial [Campylobacter lari]|nr:hypothetical protein [Campylobacter lari]EIP1689743.1 hypothetical protein [Campylobacter lari]ELK3815406.1 hypothetical protein [Campylobacter lari]
MNNNFLEKLIEEWNFYFADMICDSLVAENKCNMICIDYLFFIGNFEKILAVIDKTTEKPIWWNDTDYQNDFFIFKKNIENIIYGKFTNKQNHLWKSALYAYDLKKSFLKRDNLDFFGIEKEIMEIFRYNNIINKKYILFMILEYFKAAENIQLSQSTRIIFLLQKFFPKDKQAKEYISKLMNYRKYILEKQCKINFKPKIAVCISGVFRGNWKDCLDNIFINIVKPLEADCFVFGWNKLQIWPGKPGGIHWIRRIYGPRLYEAYKHLIGKDNDMFQTLFPNSSKKIFNEKYRYFNIKELENYKYYSYIKKCMLAEEIKHTSHTSKFFYALFKVFSLMQKYENENNIRYDYIIRIRPDIGYFNAINIEDIKHLEFNQIIVNNNPGGLDDNFLCGHYEAMSKFMNLWNKAEINKQFYPFEKYPEINTDRLHYWLVDWLAICGISTVRPNILQLGLWDSPANKGYQLPNITQELEYDLNSLSSKFSKEDILKIKDFFGKLIYDGHLRNGTLRVKNHLSYKLGMTFLNNSKTFIDYIKLPFLLFEVTRQHKKEKQEFKTQAKDHNLSPALPPLEECLDYKEVLKIQNGLPYKIGISLIKANKEWYKG